MSFTVWASLFGFLSVAAFVLCLVWFPEKPPRWYAPGFLLACGLAMAAMCIHLAGRV